MKPKTIEAFHAELAIEDQTIATALKQIIDSALPEAESKIWHAHPVWFLDDNPIVGYSKLKNCIRLMFWNGQSFSTSGLTPSGSFKAAEMRYTHSSQVDAAQLSQWLLEAREVQWDYKNIAKRKGKLVRLC